MGLFNRLKQRPKQHPPLSLHAPGPRLNGYNIVRPAQVLLLVAAGVLLNILIIWPALHSYYDTPRYPLLHGNTQLVLSSNFLDDFDSDSDGLLSPAEFTAAVQEVCAADREGLPLMRRIQRAAVLLLLEVGSPCRSFRTLFWGGSQATTRPRETLLAAGPRKDASESIEELTADQKRMKLQTCSQLDAGLLQAAASQRTILLAATDWSMFDLFGVNWLTHVRKAGITNYLVASLDQKTADFLTTNKLGHCLLWDTSSSSSSSSRSSSMPPLPSQAARYEPGSEAFKAVTWARLAVAHEVLRQGYHVLLTDLDTVWFRNPLPYLRHHALQADLVLGSTAPVSSNKAGDAGLEVASGNAAAAGWLSLGVIYAKSNAAASATFKAWFDKRDHLLAAAAANHSSSTRAGTPAPPVPLPDAQQVVTRWLQQPGALLPALPKPSTPDSSSSGSGSEEEQQVDRRLLRAWALPDPPPGSGRGSWFFSGRRTKDDQVVQIGVLSPRMLANSYSHFVWQGYQPGAEGGVSSNATAENATALLGAHLEVRGSSKELRLHSLRDAQWYADGPKYYSDPQLFSIELEPYSYPPGYNPATADEEAQLQQHAAALRHQFAQLYGGMALAALLGRVFVMPPLQCYCWSSGADANGQSNCRAVGDNISRLPFNCTMDQLFKAEALYAHLPLFAGRRLLFREHSFPDNPRLPSWIPNSKTELLAGAPRCSIQQPGGLCTEVLSSRPGRRVNQQVVLPSGLLDTQLAQLLKPYGAAKWLHTWNTTKLFKGFADPAHKQQYEAWLDGLMVPWCCRTSKLPLVLRQEQLRVRQTAKEAIKAAMEEPSGPVPAAAAAVVPAPAPPPPAPVPSSAVAPAADSTAG